MLEADIAKDASTESTILCKALDDAADLLRQRSTSMPGNLILEAGWGIIVSLVFMILFPSLSCFKIDGCVTKKISLPVQTDNTAREGKNQTLAMLQSLMVAKRRFLDMELSCWGCFHLFAFFFWIKNDKKQKQEVNRYLRFRSCQHYMGEVGHTHGPLDQRYSVVASALASCNVLQCPKDQSSVLIILVLDFVSPC